ncbi:MAG: PQQ-dependent sugar dehydrogenase [Chloroflexota bacterium]|nr:PQQ-dependent sugar dehydrogenase [Chloroflexota bacterium]
MSDRTCNAAHSPARGFCVAALAVLIGACSSNVTPSPSIASIAPGAFDPAALTVRLDPVVDGLASPVAVEDAGDGSGRLFVVEQPGRIRIVRNGVLEDRPFLDISGRIVSGGERGLLGLAFAPDFPRDPRLFVDYTNLDGNSVIASFRVPPATPDQVDPGSERILLQFDQPFANHKGGGLAFGPDRDLYIAVGDGGSGGDPLGNGQSLTTVLGKLLRIRPGAADGSRPPYTIPPDAPFLNDPDARPEIRAYGLRNPWRFSFDRETGDLWIGDVGQGAWEEVDVIRATDPPNLPLNFGWNYMEGNHCFDAPTCDRGSLVPPVAEYDHSFGCAIIGGFVGRDAAEPSLYGGYLYGDGCSGNIWVLDAARPESGAPSLVLDSGLAISSFGEDQAGRLYLTSLSDGTLYRIVPVR